MTLRAAWLGSWKAPWPQTRGRRWGDMAWALQALAQAWLLGGSEGQWPLETWEARRPQGPHPRRAPEAFAPRPDPHWVALLRHGSPNIPPQHRGAKETELRAWSWQALLEGDGSPWMAAGTVLLDKPTRLRWIALLGAVAESGRLLLPPFLAPLIPPYLATLPSGWWEVLLGALDAEGRLLPSGELPFDLPWEALRPYLEPLLLRELPATLEPHRGAPWLHELPGQGWMLDPRVRAWGRGWGAAPIALERLQSPALALGDAPAEPVASLLKGKLSQQGLPSEAWGLALASELAGVRPAAPPPSGEPTLDCLRVRWGAEAPSPAQGYPEWGARAHPGADPFHWMAAGERAYNAQDLELALRAFTWAHAHFERLEAAEWAHRAASNAASASFFWGDLRGMEAWQLLQGPQPSPIKELEALAIRGGRAEWKALEPELRWLLKAFPEEARAWNLLAEGGLSLDREDWIREALPHLTHTDVRTLMEARLQGWPTPAPLYLQPEQRLAWTLPRTLQGLDSPALFWGIWEACSNHLMRLEAALDLLEGLPGERRADRLLSLQVIADRAQVEAYSERLRKLWPQPGEGPEWQPRAMVEAILNQQAAPTWLVWGASPETAGCGVPPPSGLLQRLQEDGAVAPIEAEGLLWWGFPLPWQGAPVARALVGLAPGQPLEAPLEIGLLAPWLSLLVPPLLPEIVPTEGELLADGSEPMASVLRELVRVAPSTLSVLILGPTGSGKELAAKELHQRSRRPGKLVAINCAAFSETLLESELFGHVKGAFTGAIQDRPGAIESASGGTLFLDEVADLSPKLQSMLLRVLQEREVRKVGSDKSVRIDVRFVSATHRALEELTLSGAFRKDLLYRLQGTVLRLPSLAERSHEFPFLLPRLVALVAREARRDAPPLAPGLAQALRRLTWNGNFRELRHALERAMLRCEGEPLAPAHFPELEAPELASRTWEDATRAFQRKLLLDTLRQHGFKAADAAHALGLARPALYNTAKRLGVDLLSEREGAEPVAPTKIRRS